MVVTGCLAWFCGVVSGCVIVLGAALVLGLGSGWCRCGLVWDGLVWVYGVHLGY